MSKQGIFMDLITLAFFLYGFASWAEPSRVSPKLHPKEKACFWQCIPKITSIFQEKKYHDCMSNCSDTWLFKKGSCSNYQINTTNLTNSSRSACNPDSFNVKSFKIQTPTGKYQPYALLTWKPCAGGLQDVRGYLISIKKRFPTFAEDPICLDLKLKRRLFVADYDRQFSYVVPKSLVENKKYEVSLQAYPVFQLNVIKKNFTTHDCHRNNGPRSCYCRYDTLPPPNVIVQGYNVEVTFNPPKACFHATDYQIYLDWSPSCQHSKMVDIPAMKNSTAPIQRVFRDVYDSPLNIFAYFVVRYGQDPFFYPNVSFQVTEAWIPPAPDVNVEKDIATVTFNLTRDYDIKVYLFHLLKYKEINESLEELETLYVKPIPADEAVDGLLTFNFPPLDEGVYGVRVQEKREKTCYHNPGKLGAIQTFKILPEDHVLTIVLSTVMGTVFLAIFIILYYLLRNRQLEVIRKFLPETVIQWLDSQVVVSQKKVLLVWQADYRSNELARAQEHVVKSFATYLMAVGGLDVVVDVFEQIEMSVNFSDWFQQSAELADFYIFICPHFEYSKRDNRKHQPLMGRFDFAFRYLEKELPQSSKFVTVVLPYSQLDSSVYTSTLLSMTTTYYLMESIGDLYLYILRLNEKNLKRSFEKMSYLDYETSTEGKALALALKNMEATLSRINQGRSDVNRNKCESECDLKSVDSNLESLDSDQFNSEDDLSDALLSPVQENVRDLVPPESVSIEFDPKPRSEVASIAPLVKGNPFRAIEELNFHTAIAEEQACNSASQSATPTSYDERVYACDESRSFHLNHPANGKEYAIGFRKAVESQDSTTPKDHNYQCASQLVVHDERDQFMPHCRWMADSGFCSSQV